MVPEGFEVGKSGFYENSIGSVHGFAEFIENNNYIVFSIEQAPNDDSRLYEKDMHSVISLNLNGVEYYVFDNNGVITAAWHIGDLTCGIFSNLEKETIIGILINSYGEE